MTMHKELGASIGRALTAELGRQDTPKAAAAQFAAGAMSEHPTVKLPQLLASNDVRAWMQQAGVTESTLRVALTEERRIQRDKHSKEQAVRIPPRPRKTAKAPPAPPAVSLAPPQLFDDGLVPNRPPVARRS